MLLVDRLVEVGDVSVAEVQLREDSLFASEDGVIEESAYMEMIAQAMAARNGYVNYGTDSGNEGYLIGAKSLSVKDTARVGDTLTIKVDKIAELGGELAVIHGVVLRDETVMAEGEIKVYQSKGNGAS